jgi:exonuclease SbcD
VSIGGTGTVDLSCFDNFSFVALGHLHRNQWPASHIHYPGSPMKYSFSEVDHKKSVSIIDIDEDGSVKSQVIPLTPRRDVRSVKGTLEQILMNGHLDSNPDDYINVILSDREPQLDIISKLRDVYPNVLNIERPDFSAQIDENKIDHRTLGDLELFTAFYNQVTGKNIDDQQLALFSTLMENLHRKNRESC